eukprot:2458895-Prymnesium_polylepis.1
MWCALPEPPRFRGARVPLARASSRSSRSMSSALRRPFEADEGCRGLRWPRSTVQYYVST